MTNDDASYKSPFLLALGVHVVVFIFLLFELTFPTQSRSSSGGAVIQAVAVSQSVVDRYQQQVQQIAAEKRQEALNLQKQMALQKQQQLEKAQAIQKQIQQQKLQAQKLVEEKAQAIKVAQQKAAEKAQAAAHQKMLAQEKQAKTAKDVALKKELQQQLKASIQKQIAASDVPSSAHAASSQSHTPPSANTAQNTGEIDKYKALIIQSISQQWIVPENIAKDISCELDVRVAPGGVVLQVSVARSSGNAALDNSAVAAVNKASPLPVPTDSSLFNQFRELHLTVKPDGSMTES
jgi:colicin import membrane protein